MARIKHKPIRPQNTNSQKQIQVDTEIALSETQHQRLLEHLQKKIDFSREVRDSQADKFEKIDKKVYCYLVLDEDDTKREIDNQKGYGVKPVDQILPLTLTQLDEAVTFLLEVLSTDNGLYGAIAPKDKQPVATAFSALMNEHAAKFKHIKDLNKFLFNALKYNIGILIPEWKKVTGNKMKNNEAGGLQIEEGVVYEGNQLTEADPYNFFYDISVDPVMLAQEGEFFAIADVHTEFKVRKMAADEEIYGVDRFINDNAFDVRYYRAKPTIRAQDSSNSGNSFLSLLSSGEFVQSQNAIEELMFYIWLPEKEFGLGQDEKMSIFRVTVMNFNHIVRVQKLNNAHGMLPVGITMPWEDGFKEDTKSYAELLNPFQTFASSQMNVHTKASRKALYNVTFYNKNELNIEDNYDPIAAQIPVNAPPGTDLNKAIRQFSDTPDTNNTIADIGSMIDLMQKILPTDILRQVAGLDRATQYQSAATVQGANRRNLKIAKIIEDQAFSTVKNIEMYNVLQYQKTIEILTPEGELIEADVTAFRDTKLEFAISDGLKGLDRLSMIINIKEILNTILQSQFASQQINVVEVINYWTSMLGDKTDFSQFAFKSEMDKMDPQMRDIAFQLLQQFLQTEEGQALLKQQQGQ